MNEFDRSRRQSPEFAVPPCIAAYCIVIYQCRQDDVSICTCTNARTYPRIHTCTSKGVSGVESQNALFALTVFWADYRSPRIWSEFTSSGWQSRICFRPDTRLLTTLRSASADAMPSSDTLHNKTVVMHLCAYIRGVCKDICIYSIGFCEICGELQKRIFYWMQRRILCGSLFNYYLFSYNI